MPTLKELIDNAPWREAVTYRDTWPHEYVLTEKDGQRDLLAAVCDRFRAGEGVACRFFRMNNTYLFIGEHKYWLMTNLQRHRSRTTTTAIMSSTALASTATAATSSSNPAIPESVRTTR